VAVPILEHEMNSWVLIIAIFNPAGVWQHQYTERHDTQQDCTARSKALETVTANNKYFLRGICVTNDHWTGKKLMPGVNLD
jgi:hypothetical protein